MEIKLLPKSVRETLRSEVNFRSIAKCIAQLVYNSLDAKATSIAVRINLITFKIQVIDNGTGISKHNLKIIGFRYATSKYYTVEDLEKNPNVFPSRGECLSSIIKLSETVKITTRYLDNQKTYCKTFENGKCLPISSIKQRPSKGTTISIENFMYNLPVRKKSINQNHCLDEIKTEIENIALMHPNTTFSLRNDSNGEIIFHTLRTKYVFQTAAILYGKDFSRRLRKVCHNDGNFSVSGLISLDSHNHNRKQFIYINHRLVSKTKIHELINKIISRSKIMKNKEFTLSPVKQKHAAFIINIKCSNLELDIVDFIEPVIEFKNWKTVLSCVQDAITDFLKKYDLLVTKESKKNRYQNGTPLSESTPKVRTSQIDGVIRGITMKRKLSEEKIEQTLSSPTTINSEERKILNISHKKLTPATISSISNKDKLSPPPLKKMCSRLGKTNDNTLEEKNKKGRRKKENIPKQVNKQNIPNKTNKKENISLEKYKKLNITKGKNKTNFFTSNFDSPPRKQMKINNLETNECLNGMMNKVLKKVNKETTEENVNVTNSSNQNFPSLNLLPKQVSKMNNETNEQNLNVTLESKSDSGKQLILDKFLKSTAIFRTDDELDQHYLSFESAEKYTHRSASSCIISSLQHCKTTSTSTKISITKTIEQNININKNNHINNDENVFKIPEIPQWRKRKSNSNNSSDNVSNILAHFKSSPKIDMKPRQKNVVPKNFEVDFIKNNSLPPNLSNHFLKILDNIKKGPNNKRYECTIKITKRLDYLQSSDFLKPAKKLNRKYDLQHQKCKNISLKKHKEIVHSNSMLKTFYDLKNNFSFHKPKNYKNYHMDKYKFSYFLPNINRNYLTHKNYNVEPLSCSLKKEISNNHEPNTCQKKSTNMYLPIYNIKRSKTQKSNFEPPKIYKNTQNFIQNHENSLSFPSSILSFKPYSTHLEIDKRSNEVYCNIIDKTVKENRTNINFPSPILSFKPYNSNPHLEKHFSKQKLFSKSDFAFSKPNFNFNDPSLNNKNSNDAKSLYSFIPTYDSHQMTKESLIQHKNESKNDSKATDTLIEKAMDYFKLPNNKNVLQMLNTKDTEKTVSSNLTFLSEEKEVPETPEKVENVQNGMTENSNKKENCEPKRIIKKTQSCIYSKDKYYDANNITKWIDCTINNTPFFEVQQNHDDIIDNINKNLQNYSSNDFIKDSEYFKKDMNKSMKTNKTDNKNKNFRKDAPNNNKNIIETKEITKAQENNKMLNKTCKIKNKNANNKSSYQLSNQMNIETKEIPNIFSFISPYKSTMNESNKNLETTKNKLLNLSQNTSKSIIDEEPKKEFNFLSFLEKPKNNLDNFQFNFVNMENRSSSNLTIILSSEEKGISEKNKIPVSQLSFIDRPKNYDKNSSDISTQIRISQEKKQSDKESSPILFSFNSNPISGIPNGVKTNQNLTIELDEGKLITKDQSHISSSNFSSNSNMIQDKDVTNIISILDQSMINDVKQSENNVRNLQSPESKKNSETFFPEDNTNIVSENNRNIDEKLNNSCSNEQICNSYEIINNSLSKNSEESKEINQITTENVNGMPEWRKQTSNDGNSYYINIRTGMTSFLTPKELEGCTIMKRPAYIPKGMSPILVKSKAVTKELSQNSKNVLHKCIANTDNDELQTVKWVNFFENKDSEQFFSDLYSNIKNYESEIPNLNNYTIPKKIIKGFENYSFSKEDFDKITVINQCDNKFIVTKMEIQGKYDLLVLFDQHAVHERIRLEKLLKDYEENENKLKSVNCHIPIYFNLDKFEIKIFENYKQNFENWGFNYEIENNKIKFTHIPTCWQTKDDSNIKNKDYSTIESLLRNLIQEESNWIKNVRRINVALPLVIQNTIKTEACRTAIKFGDPLTKEQCENLMKQLFSCDLPFNCAHGRPTLFPVIDLNHLNNEEEDEINLNNLRS